MTKSILKNPSILLALGYVAGQGSVFLFQLTAKTIGLHEVVGASVLLVSFISFALQFADYGNATYVSPRVMSQQVERASLFIASRAVWAFVVCLLVSIIASVLLSYTDYLPLLVALPLLGAVCGMSATGFMEARRDYMLLVFAQSLPWIVLAGSMTLLFENTIASSTSLIAMLLLFAVIVICSWIWKRSKAATPSWDQLRRSIFVPIPYIMAPIGGQLWARAVIVMIEKSSGLAALGVFGLVRYVQIAIIRGISFLTRPMLRDYLSEKAHAEQPSYSLLELLRRYRNPFIITFAGPALSVVLWLTSLSGTYFSPWMYLMTGLPLTFIAQAAAQINQLTMCGGRLLFVDYASLGMCVLVFFYWIGEHAVVAVVASEAVYALAQIIACSLFSRFRPARY